MDRDLAAAERTFKANPTYDNFQVWFHVSRRAGVAFPLDAAPVQDFSVAEDLINNFTLFDLPLTEVYQRTQLACSNILSAANQSDTVWLPPYAAQSVNRAFGSAMWEASGAPILARRWFLCPERSMFTYYFNISKVDFDIDNETDILLFVNVPYGPVSAWYGPEVPMRIPYEKCEVCGRQAFLVEMTAGGGATVDYIVHLDCFDEDYVVEEEHNISIERFSLGHRFKLLERLERMQGTPLAHISPPPNGIELPIS